MKTFKFKTNINCQSCIDKVTPYLNQVNGVDHWEVDTEASDKVLSVTTSADKVRNVKKAVMEAGYDIEEKDEGFFSKIFKG